MTDEKNPGAANAGAMKEEIEVQIDDEISNRSEQKRKGVFANGHSERHKVGSYNSDDSDQPRWNKQTKPEAEYEYRKADGTHAYTICKGRNANGDKAFTTRRLNLLPFSDRLEPETRSSITQPWRREACAVPTARAYCGDEDTRPVGSYFGRRKGRDHGCVPRLCRDHEPVRRDEVEG